MTMDNSVETPLTTEQRHAALFAQMVMQLSSTALVMLGQAPNPMTGKTETDLETAQLLVEQLEMLEVKTKGMTDLSKAELKKRWGTMQKVVSAEPRAKQIVNDILLDMETKPRLMDGRGYAMLVGSSIYQACKFYELFCNAGFRGRCAIVTSYEPIASDISKEDSGEGKTEKIRQYEIYRRWRSRYAPGVTHNTEHVFSLLLPERLPVAIEPREHLGYEWLPWRAAADKVFSWSNAEAIRELPQRAAAATAKSTM